MTVICMVGVTTTRRKHNKNKTERKLKLRAAAFRRIHIEFCNDLLLLQQVNRLTAEQYLSKTVNFVRRFFRFVAIE